jgi:predicted transposase YdaD
MAEGADEEFPEALLPLLEITDEEQQITLTKETLVFIDKVYAAHNRRLEAEMVNKVLKPILRERERTMIVGLFEEKYLEGIADGEARGEARGKAEGKTEGKAETVLAILQAKFNRIPKSMEKTIRSMSDPIALESLAVHAAISRSLKEFAKALE